MLEFFRMVLKWMLALVVAYGVLFILLLSFFGSLTLSLPKPQPIVVEEGTFLALDLNTVLADSPDESSPEDLLLAAVMDERVDRLTLRQVQVALADAATDPNIVGLLIRGSLIGGPGANLPNLREMGQSIRAFGNTGKTVVAYVDADRIGDYALKAVADEVLMNDVGLLEFAGLGVEGLYVGEALSRNGVGIQVSATGEYKTAYESLTAAEMSAAEREQTAALLDDVWTTLRESLSESRQIDAALLERVAQTTPYLSAADARRLGLVDEAVTRDAFAEKMVRLGAYDEGQKTFRHISIGEYSNLAGDLGIGGTNKVAVLYAEGVIVDGISGEDLVGGETVTERLEALALDDDVAAVVLRVNSPGGSVLPSAMIARAVSLLDDRKPVVVSMGGVAASGGYMIAAPARRIFADPATITGSIGVVGAKVNLQQLGATYGVNWQYVATSPFANMESVGRPFTEEELVVVRDLEERYYRMFLDLVATNRNLDPQVVRGLAGGRVWSGVDARERGLVDELGGLKEAIQAAADLAGIEDYEVMEVPHRMSFGERLGTWISGDDGSPYSGVLGEATSGPLSAALTWVDPRLRIFVDRPDRLNLYSLNLLSLRLD